LKVTVRIEGGEELLKKLNSLDRAYAKKICSKVLRYTSKVFADEIRGLLPVRSGALRDNVTVRATKRKKFRLGTQVLFGGSKLYQGEQYYGAMVNYGHFVGPRYLGTKRKYVEGTHSMETGFKNKASKLQKEAPQLLWEEIRKAVA